MKTKKNCPSMTFNVERSYHVESNRYAPFLLSRELKTIGIQAKFLLGLLVVIFLNVACSQEDDLPLSSATQTSAPDEKTLNWDYEDGIYIAGGSYGQKKDIAQVWGNGELQVITDGELDAIATCVYVSDADVYLTGYEYNWDVYNGFYRFPNKAMIWKNGVAQALTDGNLEAGAFSIFEWNEDVYVAGHESTKAMLWKNGMPIPLSDGEVPTNALSVFVSNDDVYVVGNEQYGDFSKAVLWKNGNLQSIGEGSTATSVFVSGNDVFVAGYNASGAMLWKNGTEQLLLSNGVNPFALSVFVSGEDVYLSGFDFSVLGEKTYGPTRAMVWKNGVPIPLTDGKTNALANSISVSGDDVYVVGHNGDIAVIWKNGIAKSLGAGDATGLFVKK